MAAAAGVSDREWLIVAGVVLGLWVVSRPVAAAVGAAVENVSEAREDASMWLTDLMAWVTGLDARQNAILEHETYAEIEAAGGFWK